MLLTTVLLAGGCGGGLDLGDPSDEDALTGPAGVTVTAPTDGATVTSPFAIQAQAGTCNGAPVNAMAYSLDTNPDVLFSGKTSIRTTASASNGAHILYVKAWAGSALCKKQLNFTVSGTASPLIPPNAVAIKNIETLTNWKWVHDSGTPGSTTNDTSSVIAKPSRDGTARVFSFDYQNHGGERYSVDFGKDGTATHFVYDAWVNLANPSNVLNLELDMNQVLSDRRPVIFATQCSGVPKTWEYTVAGHWHPSNIPCNPATWTPNVWHHVQIASHRDSAGYVTYDWVSLDGVTSKFVGAAGDELRSITWAADALIINFQIEGVATNGSIKAYADDITIWRW
jgi:hypothetical protein